MLIPRRVLLWLLFALTFLPLLGVGYTTNDDTHVYFFFTYSWSHLPLDIVSSFRLALLQFFYSSRPTLPLLIVGPVLSLISATYHHPLFMRLASISGLAVNVYLFHRILNKAFNSANIAHLGAVLFLAFAQNSWDHNLLTSFMPHLYVFSLVLLSFLFFYEYLDSRESRHLILSASAYFLSLSYETNLVYVPLFFVIAFCRERSLTGAPASACLREASRNCRPTAIVTAAWMLVYLAMRRVNAERFASLLTAPQLTNPEAHAGYAFSTGTRSLRRIADVIFCHGISAFPGFVFAYYHGFLNQYSPAFAQFRLSPLSWWREVQMTWLIRAAIVSWMIARLLRSLRKDEARSVAVFPGLLVGFYLIFAPGVPVSLVEKYQEWVQAGTFGYSNSYHSMFGMVFIFLVVIAHLVTDAAESLPKKFQTPFRKTAIATAALLAFGGSLATDCANSAFALSQSQSNYKWKCVDLFLRTPEFKSLPAGSVIYAPSLFSQIGLMKIFQSYWTDYIAYKSGETRDILREPGLQGDYLRDPRVIFNAPGKHIRVVGSPDDPKSAESLRGADNLYCMKYAQEKKDSNQFFAFTKAQRLKADGGRWDCVGDEVAVYTLSKYRDFNLYGTVAGNPGNKPWSVDGVPQPKFRSVFFSAHVSKDDARQAPIRTVVRAAGIDLGTLSISNYVDADPPPQ